MVVIYVVIAVGVAVFTCVQITEFPVEKLFNGSWAAAMHIFRISRRDGVD